MELCAKQPLAVPPPTGSLVHILDAQISFPANVKLAAFPEMQQKMAPNAWAPVIHKENQVRLWTPCFGLAQCQRLQPFGEWISAGSSRPLSLSLPFSSQHTNIYEKNEKVHIQLEINHHGVKNLLCFL